MKLATRHTVCRIDYGSQCPLWNNGYDSVKLSSSVRDVLDYFSWPLDIHERVVLEL